jgi:hypothetical protein
MSEPAPWQLRPYYSLIADPAAGTVTVVARVPRLANPGFWRSSLDPQEDLNVEWPFNKRWWHRIFCRSIDAVKKLVSAPWPYRLVLYRRHKDMRLCVKFQRRQRIHQGEDSRQQALNRVRAPWAFALGRAELHTPNLLFRSWMTIAMPTDFVLARHNTRDTESREIAEEKIFVVDIDFDTTKRTTPLQMTWHQ